MEKQLEQLNQEVADFAAKRKAIQKNWLSATDPQLKADLEKVYDYTQEIEKRLDSRQAALEARLLGAGERTPLLPC